MKYLLLFSILFCVIAMPALGELSDDDLNQIRLIFADSEKQIRLIIADSEKRLTATMNTLKTEAAIRDTEIKNLNDTMNKGFDNVQKGFDNVQKNFDNVQKGFDRQNNIIIACIGIPMAFLAIGATISGILAHKRGTRDRSLENEIATLKQEMETLKQRQVITP